MERGNRGPIEYLRSIHSSGFHNSLASDVVVNFEINTVQTRQAKGESVHIFPIVLEPFWRRRSDAPAR